MKTTFSLISAYANRNVTLLTAQISQQLTILQAVKSVLPEELAEHAVHCVREPKKLIVFTDSPVWAAKLRFYQGAILSAIQHSANSVTGIQIKVLNNYFAKAITKAPIIPSPNIIDEIKQLSARTDDGDLKNALAKLGATLSRAREKN